METGSRRRRGRETDVPRDDGPGRSAKPDPTKPARRSNPALQPIADFAKSGRIMRAMRIFRMFRAVRAARAVAKLSANQDLFDAAAAGNLAMIAKKAKSSGPSRQERVSSRGGGSRDGSREDREAAASASIERERAQLWRLNAYGETALHVAAARGHERVVKYLLERKSCESVDPRDLTTGATPLWNACHAAKKPAARVLMSKGADLNLAPVFGEHRGVTAKRLAMAKHWDELIAEAEEIRAAEEQRLAQQRERRERRRNRVAIARAERDRKRAEAEASRREAEERRVQRAKDRVKQRFTGPRPRGHRDRPRVGSGERRAAVATATRPGRVGPGVAPPSRPRRPRAASSRPSIGLDPPRGRSTRHLRRRRDLPLGLSCSRPTARPRPSHLPPSARRTSALRCEGTVIISTQVCSERASAARG